MARTMTPEAMAKHIRKWADVGVDSAIVTSTVGSLQHDRASSAARAPNKSGRLARTVRVQRPTVARTKRTGVIRAALAAGSRSGDRRRAVQYASVLQTGKVGYPAKGKTREHVIRARRGAYAGNEFLTTGVLSFLRGGLRVYARSVKHPGSKFPALGYLKVDERRLATDIERGIDKSFEFPVFNQSAGWGTGAD